MVKNKKYLLAILIAAALLRLINLSAGDTLGDEVLYAFRAVGPMDYDNAALQTTPLEWQDPNIAWWTKLSFHDHPPLVFWIQHIFVKIFGEKNFAFRLPSAILGILSVYLVFLIGRRLISEQAGLIASSILAVTVNHVFISRIGLQESYVIFFILLTSYFFLRALKNSNNFLWAGLFLGLAFLTKYTTLILAPIFITYLILFRRDLLKNKKLWLGILIALIIFSPIIIYNLKLYQASGHFDFQFSYILGQNPEVWKVAPGKTEIGSLADRIHNFLPTLVTTNSWLFLLLFLISLPRLIKNKFLLISFAYLILLLLIIGPTVRFLTMLTPLMALAIGLNFWKPGFRWKPGFFLAVFLTVELFYSINSQLLPYPRGPEFWTFAQKARAENYNWGYNELDNYFKKELAGKMPALAFEPKYQFINAIQQKNLEQAKKQNLESYPALIIYDDKLLKIPQLWILDRLQIYHSWPIIKTQHYYTLLDQYGPDYFERSGFKNYYFIFAADKIPGRQDSFDSRWAENLKQELTARDIEPISLFNQREEEIFKIYKF